MTEKVKITREQATFIEKYLFGVADAEELLEAFAGTRNLVNSIFHPLQGLGVADLARALLIGYEIDPEYKVGDWISFRTHDNRLLVCIIENIGDTSVGTDCVGSNGYKQTFGKTRIRHATPEEIKAEKERRKWAEIEEGDVLRKIPMAYEIAIYQGDADDISILVKNDSGQHLWRKDQVELYAKKAGVPNA